MNASTFQALIQLLDDTDPEVFEQAEKELILLGNNGVDRLERAWENSQDPLIQKRLEDVIHKIQMSQLTQDLFQWRLDGGKDLLEGWTILSKLHYPTINFQKNKNEINRLINKAWLEMKPEMNDIDKFNIINTLIFEIEKFNPSNKEKLHLPENNFLPFLMEKKSGNSLSLTVLYLLICRRLDLQVQIVNFENYYALKFFFKDIPYYLDPFNKGEIFNSTQVETFLKRIHSEKNPNQYKPLSNIYIILQFLNLLITNYENMNEHDKANEIRELLESIEIKF